MEVSKRVLENVSACVGQQTDKDDYSIQIKMMTQGKGEERMDSKQDCTKMYRATRKLCDFPVLVP